MLPKLSKFFDDAICVLGNDGFLHTHTRVVVDTIL